MSDNLGIAVPQESTVGLIDQIEIEIDLPTGPQGEQGEPGTGWITGEGPPSVDLVVPVGTLYLQDAPTGQGGNGDYYQYTETGWLLRGNLEGPRGNPTVHNHPSYVVKERGEVNIGLTVYGWGNFTETVTAAAPVEPEHLATKAYVDERDGALISAIQSSAITRFIGQTREGTSALPAPDDNWDLAIAQGIYQTTDGRNQPPGVGPLDPCVGIVMASSPGNCAQMLCSLGNGMWYSRVQRSGAWSKWVSLVPFQSVAEPTEVAPGGSIWIVDED